MLPNEAHVRAQLGDELVDDFLHAAHEVGRAYLTSDESLVFGFIQRVLLHMRNQGRNRGLLFPKLDERYRPMFDYFDGEDRIAVITVDDMPLDPAWIAEREGYFEVPLEQARPILLAFLTAYVNLRVRSAGAPPRQAGG